MEKERKIGEGIEGNAKEWGKIVEGRDRIVFKGNNNNSILQRCKEIGRREGGKKE